MVPVIVLVMVLDAAEGERFDPMVE